MNITKIWILLIIAINLLCYSNIYKNEFLFDDLPVITENGATVPPVNFSKIFLTPSWWAEKESVRGYRPITTLSFALNRAIHGTKIEGYHFVNVLIHVASSLLIYFLILTLFNRKLLAGIISLLFTTHPIHTEAVTGIFGRADELVAFFVLLALWCYIKAWQLSLRKGVFLLGLSSICLLAGLGSKESTACFVLIVIVYEICFNFFPLSKISEADKKIIIAKGVISGIFLLIILGYILGWRPYVTGQFGDFIIAEGYRPPGLLHNWPIIWRLTAFVAFAYYIKLLFWPVVLSGDYLFNQIPLTDQISDPLVFTGLILFVGFLCLGFCALVKGYVGIAFGIFLLYAAYIPMSNLFIPVGVLVGERLFYLPSLGFCIVIGLIFEYLFNMLKRKTTLNKAIAVTTSVFSVVIICYGSRAFARNFDWRNPYVFFKKTSQTSPNSAVSHYSTAVAYLKMTQESRYIERWMRPREIQKIRAEKDKGKRILIENGLKSISKALKITKEHPNMKYFNVYGALLTMAGRLEQAKDVFIMVIDKDPDLLEAKVALGCIYMRLASEAGKKKNAQSKKIIYDYLTESVRYLQEAETHKEVLSETPMRMAEVYLNLSIAHARLGKYDDAMAYINNAFLWINKSIERMGEGQFLIGRLYVIKAGILTDKRDYEGAIDALIRAKQAGFPQLQRYIMRMKQLKPLHKHPKFQKLINERRSG
jgi:tetratricopeptide (TPR) repeat protein